MSVLFWLEMLFVQLAAMTVLMLVAWFCWFKTRNSGWIDTGWTFSVGLVGVVSALWVFDAEVITGRQIIVSLLLAVWALRLGGHIALRTLSGGRDARYASLESGWGASANVQMLRFCLIQALAALPLLITITAASHAPGSLMASDWLGVAILAGAIVGEAVSDRQLLHFRRQPANKGAVCDVGLWSWSRHPNYFFQWGGWLAYAVIALRHWHQYGAAPLSILAAVYMYWLLVYVSGIPPLEVEMQKSRGKLFDAYKARTNAFFPWPPNTSSHKS